MKLKSKIYSVFRCIVCLVVVCFILFCSAFQAYATSLGAAGIVKASLVTGNPYVIVGAALLAVGVMAGVQTGAFENAVNNVVDFLDSAGGWIENGTMQLLKTVDAVGETMYCVSGDLLETIRSWVFDTGVVSSSTYEFEGGSTYRSYTGKGYCISVPFTVIKFHYSDAAKNGIIRYCELICTPTNGYFTDADSGETVHPESPKIDGQVWRYFFSSQLSTSSSLSPSLVSGSVFMDEEIAVNGINSTTSNAIERAIQLYAADSFGYVASGDLTLGYVSNTAIDGDTYDDAYANYMRKQLRVINTGGSGDSGGDGNNNWKWYIPLALAGSLAAIAGMTQDDQWNVDSPEEFPETSTVTEFEILDTPEIDGYQGLEISPNTGGSPDAGGDSDPDTDPTTAPDPDPNPEPAPEPDGGDPNDPDSGDSDFDPSMFYVDWRAYFPFCIPWDLYDFFAALNADPVAPQFHWEIEDLSGNVYSLDIDLSAWDSLAKIFRTLQIFLFVTGLAAASQKFIKW